MIGADWFIVTTHHNYINLYIQGIDGSGRKPAQDIDYMVEKTYHLAPYLDPLGPNSINSQNQIRGLQVGLEK